MPAEEHLQRESLFSLITEKSGAVFPSGELQGSKSIPHFHPGFTGFLLQKGENTLAVT